MSFVTDFKQYLSKKKSEQKKEHYTIYNYLLSFCHDEQKLSTDLFSAFYRKALLFPYWQRHFSSLHKTLKTELISFAKFHYSIDFDPEELESAEQWQLITLQKEKDISEMIDFYLKNILSPGDRIKVLPFNEDRVLALILKFDGNLDVFSFGPLTIIREGRLEPLTPLSKLHYSSQYELKPTHPQVVEDMNLNFTHFRVKEEKATGYQCQSLCFQQSNQFKQQNLNETLPLFYLLKKTESLFIQSKSDPHYKQLIKSLHEHYRHILMSPEDNSLETQQILSQAKKALENLYPQDRLLFLLTANIDFHYRKKQALASQGDLRKQTGIYTNPM